MDFNTQRKMKKELSSEEELILLKDYKMTGNIESKIKVMNSYIDYLEGLCLSKYNDKDLLSEAYIVLDDVLENKYDYKKGVRLITRAYPFIIHTIDEYLTGHSFNGKMNTVMKKKKEFFKTYGYEPDNYELAEEYGLKISDVEYARSILDVKTIEIDENFDDRFCIAEEENIESMLLSVPNGILTIEEKWYLQEYLKGKTNRDLSKETDKNQNYWLGIFNSIVNKLKNYYKKVESE